jgi:integral membrane protein (TIGR01906 family)
MRLNSAGALGFLIAAAVPIVLLGNALWLLFNPWLVDVQYALPGFPDEPSLSDGERRELAVTGVDSVRPWGGGTELLREAELPDGEPAFTEREIQHMADVRGLLAAFLIAWAVSLVLAVGAALALRRVAEPGAVTRAVARGAIVSLAAIALIGLVMLIDFEFFFDGFHGVFFEGDSWRFNETYTLRQLYPDYFWAVAGGGVAALVLLQAAAVLLVVRRRAHADRSRGERSTLDGSTARAHTS